MEEELTKTIINELLCLGYKLNHIGTYFISETILLAYYSNNINVLNNLEKNVYINISNKYGRNIETIKSNILKATNYMNTYGNNEKIKEYFKICDYEKVTPKQVISTVLNKISIFK